MELKQRTSALLLKSTQRFNRTFMELKHVSALRILVRSPRFNRTFMELKHEYFVLGPDQSHGLIVPLWN